MVFKLAYPNEFPPFTLGRIQKCGALKKYSAERYKLQMRKDFLLLEAPDNMFASDIQEEFKSMGYKIKQLKVNKL